MVDKRRNPNKFAKEIDALLKHYCVECGGEFETEREFKKHKCEKMKKRDKK